MTTDPRGVVLFDRRTLLSGAAALSLAGAFGAGCSRPARARDGVLVVLFLRGGLDALSLCVPHGDDDLYRARPRLAIPRPGAAGGALDLDGFHGFAPAAAPLLESFRDGRLAVVQAVGSPRPTRSHFDAMRSVETAADGPLRPATSAGWLARLLEVVPAEPGSVLRAVSLETHLPDSLAGGRAALAIPDPTKFGALRDAHDRAALRELTCAGRDRDASAARDALAAMQIVETARVDAREPPRGASYPASDLGRKLALTAAWIRARLGVEVFTLDAGGFDMHRELGARDGAMAEHVDDLSRALSAFARDLAGDLERVTLVAVSEFGRRVAENGSGGTDHGRGGLALVLGGAVHGGRVCGRWPGLAPERLDEGDLAATSDVRDVLAEAALSARGDFDVGSVFPGHALAHVGSIGR
jgi:uncharacterized protein (DUF1501 family)